MSKHNLALLIDAARLLEPLLGELVFVGGSTTALLITDKAAADVRPTYDVDGYLLPDAASQARISTVLGRLKQIAAV
jgi:hypothetical protein